MNTLMKLLLNFLGGIGCPCALPIVGGAFSLPI